MTSSELLASAEAHLRILFDIFMKANAVHFGAEGSVRDMVWDYASREGRAKVLWPLRYALTGREKSPDPFLIASILGGPLVCDRISNAIKLLESA